MSLSLFLMKGKRNYLATFFLMTLLLAGCSSWFSGVRYPDLRKVEVNALAVNPTKPVIPILQLKKNDSSILHMNSKKPDFPYISSLLLEKHTNTKSTSIAKIILKSIWKNQKLLTVKKTKSLIAKTNEPPKGLIAGLIVLAFIFIILALVFLPFSVSGQSGCLMILLGSVVLIGIVILLLSLT